mgnify:CR=1 FL=1
MDYLRTKNRSNMIKSANPLLDILFFEKKILKSFKKTLKSGNYVLGKNVKKFEKNFARYNQSNYCVGVASGTDAIYLAIKSLEIGKGDEIITVANTASATIAAIIQSGAKPILIDIDQYYLMDTKPIGVTLRRHNGLKVHRST